MKLAAGSSAKDKEKRLKKATMVSGVLNLFCAVPLQSFVVFLCVARYFQAMPLHIIKLCVGCDSLSELADWQKKRLKEKRAKGQKPELVHVTRMTPKRGDEVLDGGSLYWVIKGQIAARQKLLAFREVKKNGIPHCGLVYDKTLVPVVARPRRAFQGWRYLEDKDAPPDLARTKGATGLPEKLQRELAALGLL
jgi:hypothetical protein